MRFNSVIKGKEFENECRLNYFVVHLKGFNINCLKIFFKNVNVSFRLYFYINGQISTKYYQ